MSPLPAFHKDASSPPLPASGSGVAIASSGDGPIHDVVLSGSYRVTAADRPRLGPARIRHQLWLVAIQRDSRAAFWGRACGEAVVFAEEEAEGKDVEGFFHIALAAAARINEKALGLYDVSVVLGPFASKPIAVTLRR